MSAASTDIRGDRAAQSDDETTKMTKKYSRGDGLETSRRIAEARKANRLSATAVKQ